MKYLFLTLAAFIFLLAASAQKPVKLKKKDRKRDIELVTTEGTLVLRLYDATPLHRDNFLKLVKGRYFDSLLFHRVIEGFMIQSGDPDSKRAAPGQPLGDGGPAYTVPAEFNSALFHKKGTLAAARENDDINPEKASSASQFYLVQGKKYTDSELDSLETLRLKRKLPAGQREVYKTLGGTPSLDQRYTVVGEVVKGLEVVDKIAAVPTSKGVDKDRPLTDVRILKARLVKRR